MDAHGLLRDDVLLERYRYPPGPAVELPSHAHEEYQFNLSFGEPGGVRYRGAFHVVPAGVLAALMPGEVHTPRDPDSRDGVSEHLTLYVSADSLQEAAGSHGDTPSFRELTVTDTDLVRRFAEAHAVLSEPESALGQDVLLLQLLADLVTRHAEARHSQPPAAHHAVRRTRDYLHDNLTENVTLARLAQVSGVSRFHLTRIFTAAVGMPPHAYQVQLRLSHAKRWLLAGVPPNDVALRAGFFDLSHFTRHFRRHVGVPPGVYASKIVQYR